MIQTKWLTTLMITAGLVSGTALADPATSPTPSATAPKTSAAPVAATAPAPVATTPAVTATTTTTSAPTKAMIDQEIRAYLLANPEILIEMSQKLQAKQQQQMMEKAGSVIITDVKQLAHDPQSPIAGNLNGKVTVIEFFDYQCPHCKAMVGAIDGLQTANKNVRIIYKEMPIFGPESEFAAKAALAAAKQGKYQAFHHALMKTQGRLTDQQILDIAKSLGLDTNKLLAVMNSPEISAELQANGQLAQKLGLPGTPAFIVLTETAGKVDYRFIPGQTDQATLQQAVDQVSGTPVKPTP